MKPHRLTEDETLAMLAGASERHRARQHRRVEDIITSDWFHQNVRAILDRRLGHRHPRRARRLMADLAWLSDYIKDQERRYGDAAHR